MAAWSGMLPEQEWGGRIVGHLLFPGDAMQTQQSLEQLQSAITGVQSSLDVLQGLQVANLVLSGLNLAVTTAGFVVVCKKLNTISEQIQQQSREIHQTLELVKEVHVRGLLTDAAEFYSLLQTAQQFCEQGEVEQLKGLIRPLNREYQFNRMVLQQHAPLAAGSIDRLHEIALLQERLVNLGLMLSHVQLRTGAAKYSHECLTQLSSDLREFNRQRIEVLTSDSNIASKLTQERFAEVTDFLQRGKQILPALHYQAEVLELEMRHPGLLQKTSGASEILLLAA